MTVDKYNIDLKKRRNTDKVNYIQKLANDRKAEILRKHEGDNMYTNKAR